MTHQVRITRVMVAGKPHWALNCPCGWHAEVTDEIELGREVRAHVGITTAI